MLCSIKNVFWMKANYWSECRILTRSLTHALALLQCETSFRHDAASLLHKIYQCANPLTPITHGDTYVHTTAAPIRRLVSRLPIVMHWGGEPQTVGLLCVGGLPFNPSIYRQLFQLDCLLLLAGVFHMACSGQMSPAA